MRNRVRHPVIALAVLMVVLAVISCTTMQPEPRQSKEQTLGETRINLEVPQPVLDEATAFAFVFAGDQVDKLQGGTRPGSNPFVSPGTSGRRMVSTSISFDRQTNMTTLLISGDRPVKKSDARLNVGYTYVGDYREVAEVVWHPRSGAGVLVADVDCAFSHDREAQTVRVIARNKSKHPVAISEAAVGVFRAFPSLEELNSKNFPASRLTAAPILNIRLPPGNQTPPLVMPMKSDEVIVSRAVIRFSDVAESQRFQMAGGDNLSLWSFKPTLASQ